MTGNLTRLRVLDLSHNKLGDITTDEEVFKLPVNLSELYLTGNSINTLPWRNLKNVSRLEVLDVRDNGFDAFGPELMKMVEGGTSVRFEGKWLTYVKVFIRLFIGVCPEVV